MQETILNVENLQVSLPTENGPLNAVRGLDFTVNRGEMLCIVGESGCGKSMTSMALMDLLPKKAQCQADKFEFLGQDLLHMPKKTRSRLRGLNMSMIFQEPMTSLNPSFKLGDQLTEGIMTHQHISRKEANERAIYLLNRAGVPSPDERLNQYPHELSGGLRQRIMIAMALMCEPDLIIADEPTTALDVTIQAQILVLIRELQQEFGMAVIFITHDLGVVARIADRVAVMYAGQFVEMASVKAIYSRPQHPYTRGLLNCIPIPGKTQSGQELATIAGVVPSLIGTPQGCAFANRCELAKKQCCETIPALEQREGQHWVRCPVTLYPVKEAS